MLKGEYWNVVFCSFLFCRWLGISCIYRVVLMGGGNLFDFFMGGFLLVEIEMLELVDVIRL